MKWYVLTILFVLAVELGILFGISYFFKADLLTTMFLGSLFFIFFAFIVGSKGDALTKGSELAVFKTFVGAYQPKHENPSMKIGPFLLASIFCLIVYLIMSYTL